MKRGWGLTWPRSLLELQFGYYRLEHDFGGFFFEEEYELVHAGSTPGKKPCFQR